jgi:hypothetical protein
VYMPSEIFTGVKGDFSSAAKRTAPGPRDFYE